MEFLQQEEFPHPLSHVKQSAGYRFSYQIGDSLIWLGIRDMINDVWKKKLNLKPITYFSGSQGSENDIHMDTYGVLILFLNQKIGDLKFMWLDFVSLISHQTTNPLKNLYAGLKLAQSQSTLALVTFKTRNQPVQQVGKPTYFLCFLTPPQNKYKCSRCKSYEKVRKKLMLLEAPNVLTISLKRFHCAKFGKLTKSVEFPEILDMAPYVSGSSDKSPIYRLYGVVVHVDTMNDAFSGQYVCYVKNHHNQWFKFNDTMVNEVDLQHVLTKGAYMLFYARCSPRTPRSIRTSIIQHQDGRKHKTFVHSTEPWQACNYQPTSYLGYRYQSLE
ncbi:unnamed protein product [Lactuca saligna]|uniref:USP domain-containing protein n=1 Tax=Lactuca saligna TaxID=75948 RepID=A0AA36EN66_LACSI|nr:unnamed protein product [Lactuca saligna]